MEQLRMFKREFMKDDSGFREKCYRLLTYTAIALVTCTVLSFLWIYLSGDYARSTKAMREAKQYIAAYQQEVIQYEQAVKESPNQLVEVDQVQNILVQKLGFYGIDIRGMQALSLGNVVPGTKNTAPTNGIEYEMTVVGAWESIMKYLNDIKREPALINLRAVKIENAEGGNLKTTFKYKIYTAE